MILLVFLPKFSNNPYTKENLNWLYKNVEYYHNLSGESKIAWITLDNIDEMALGISGCGYDMVIADPEFRQPKKETIRTIRDHLESRGKNGYVNEWKTKFNETS